MTSEEIRNRKTGTANCIVHDSDRMWFKEIAYQLAVMNERNSAEDKRHIVLRDTGGDQ